MKKKRIVICILAAVLLMGIAGYGIWQYQLPRFHDVTVELGTGQIMLDHFLTIYGSRSRASFVSDLEQIDWSRPGCSSITLQHGRKKETVKLFIQDTIAPEVTFIEHLTKGIGYTPKASDFVSEYEDLSAVTVSFLKPPEIPADHSDMKVTVVVTDASGNATEKECTLSFSWVHPQLTLELGQKLTKKQVLLDYRRDRLLVDQGQLDAINNSGVGEYIITSAFGGKTERCVVTVVDTTGPKLVLQAVQVYQTDAVEAEAFVVSATDLSGDVKVRLVQQPDTAAVGVKTVIIEAEDIYGNLTREEAQLEVVADTEAPTINFSGSLTVGKNSSPDYLKGVSAYDAHDGVCEVTCDSSAVDLTKAGTYKVVYTAKDAAGNTAQKKRNVVVSPDQSDTDALVKKIAATLSDDVKEIRNYVREIEYTHNWGGDDPTWFGFTKGHGNCYVHALCLQALLEEKGYETQLIWVEGSTPGSDVAANGWGPHYWLIIKLDGQWKHIDATPGPTHTIYDEPMNDQQRLETLKQRTWDTSRWPACP